MLKWILAISAFLSSCSAGYGQDIVQKLLQQSSASIVKIKVSGTTPGGRDHSLEGSGVVVATIKNFSVVVTAAHVIGTAGTWRTTSNGSAEREINVWVPRIWDSSLEPLPLPPIIADQNDRFDYAILLIHRQLPALALGDPLKLPQSSATVLMGYALSEVTLDVLPGRGQLDSRDAIGVVVRLSQTQSNPGDSGGPVLGPDGRVLAILSGALRAQTSQDLAIPITYILPSLIPLGVTIPPASGSPPIEPGPNNPPVEDLHRWKGASVSNSGKVSFAWGTTESDAGRKALDGCRSVGESCDETPAKVASVESAGWLVVVNCNGRFTVGRSQQGKANAEAEAKSKIQSPANCRTDRVLEPWPVPQGLDDDHLWKAVSVSASGNVKFEWGFAESVARRKALDVCGRSCGVVSGDARWWIAVMKCGSTQPFFFPLGASQWDIVEAQINAKNVSGLPSDVRNSCSLYQEYVGGIRGRDYHAKDPLSAR
jgi:trypsin-like peptidase